MNNDLEQKISALAGKLPPAAMIVDINKLISAYYSGVPDMAEEAQRVSFGTSGHRGSSFDHTFNEWHVLAITQAICNYRAAQHIVGPLFLAVDTHALSKPASNSALEVLAANGVEVLVAEQDEYTPTPVLSHAILTFNSGRTSGFADGIVITPSHNPPQDGGFKYNSTNGGPADTTVTKWIENEANKLLLNRLQGVKRVPLSEALRAHTTHSHDFLTNYVNDLGNVLDMPLIRDSQLKIGVDPLGGAGVHYWRRIAERYQLQMTIISEEVDATFRFMSLDRDGIIRMDPSSPYTMQRLISQQDKFDIALACDPDHDRHGIVTRSAGLMPANHYLSVMVDYLFQHRPLWANTAGVGKTVVTSSMIDRISSRLGRKVYEMPVGFKSYVEGLLASTLGFAGEESAGASFLRTNGTTWTTDKDGIIAALLAAEITAGTGREPGELYRQLTDDFGEPFYDRVSAPANAKEKAALAQLSPDNIKFTQLAGEDILQVLTVAPGNQAAINGLKVVTESGWFAARPSGTEDIYKIYAESFRGEDHLRQLIIEAEKLVGQVLASAVD